MHWTVTDLLCKEMLEVKRSAVAAGGDLLLVLPGLTLCLVLLVLTLRDVGAEGEKLLSNLDLLDVGEGVVALPVHGQGDGI